MNVKLLFFFFYYYLFRNFTLQQVLLPLSDVTKSYHKDPEKTQQALHRVGLSVCLCPICWFSVGNLWLKYLVRE